MGEERRGVVVVVVAFGHEVQDFFELLEALEFLLECFEARDGLVDGLALAWIVALDEVAEDVGELAVLL